jgi:hypothetical protein
VFRKKFCYFAFVDAENQSLKEKSKSPLDDLLR